MTLSNLTSNSLYKAQGGLLGLGNWATITATTGSPTTGTYTDASGVAWKWYRWTGNGSVTVNNAGVVDAIVVGAGQNAQSGYSWPDARAGGAAGVFVSGIFVLPSGSNTITVGTAATRPAVPGASSIGSVVTANGGVGANTAAGQGSNNYGLASSITGSSLEYSYINGSSDPGVTDSGYGVGSALNTTSGATNGVVIIRVPTAFALA